MSFGQPSRSPYVKDGRTFVRVTSAIGIIDKSGPLMHWAAKTERAAIVGRLQDILKGDEPLTVNELNSFIQDLGDAHFYRAASEEAAGIGRVVHGACEADMKGLPIPPFGRPEEEAAFQSYLNWKQQSDVSDAECEVELYHDRLGYAGRADCIARVNGVLTMIDFKTSNNLYPENKLQVAAYADAARENGYDIQAGLLLLIPKTEGNKFQTQAMSQDDLADGMLGFLHALGLYKHFNPQGAKKQVRRAKA